MHGLTPLEDGAMTILSHMHPRTWDTMSCVRGESTTRASSVARGKVSESANTTAIFGNLMFKHAIVRPPAANFADGLTSANLGMPVLKKALEQHARYCQALRECGLELTQLEADAAFPDSTFVEDTAVLTPRTAILTHPGARS